MGLYAANTPTQNDLLVKKMNTRAIWVRSIQCPCFSTVLTASAACRIIKSAGIVGHWGSWEIHVCTFPKKSHQGTHARHTQEKNSVLKLVQIFHAKSVQACKIDTWFQRSGPLGDIHVRKVTIARTNVQKMRSENEGVQAEPCIFHACSMQEMHRQHAFASFKKMMRHSRLQTCRFTSRYVAKQHRNRGGEAESFFFVCFTWFSAGNHHWAPESIFYMHEWATQAQQSLKTAIFKARV